MALPTLTKTWTHSVNNRLTPFVSLNATAAAIMFSWKSFLIGTMGMTLKYSCDGTTGPTSSSDHTDRWASAANCTTRGAASGNAQSFLVWTDANGADWLMAYQGASDDIVRFALSPGGLYTPAGTANQQPTATDEVPIMSGVTFVNSTASSDRVWHMQASTDKKLARLFIYRQSTLVCSLRFEQTVSLVTAVTWSNPVIGANSITSGSSSAASAGGAFGSTAAIGAQGCTVTRISTTNVKCFGGTLTFSAGSTNPFGVTTPSLQAASPATDLYLGSSDTNFEGPVAKLQDIWLPYVSGYNQGDVMGSNQFYFFGTYLVPGDGVNAPQIT